MTYQETLDYMYQQLPMFHRIGKLAYKADLTTALTLDDYFDHPHRRYLTIHVAGTNGKGSVSHMLASVLQAAGYKTGLFTSPHLVDFRERIRVNGHMILPDEVITFIEQSKDIFATTKPSFFEMTSALAFDYFAREKVDVAVIEVGMGGRLDSTNIITPQLSVITNIGFDHTEFLGSTLGKIAGEKAGIIKAGVSVVIGEYNEETWPVFQQKALEMHSPIVQASVKYNAEGTPAPEGQFFAISSNEKLLYNDLLLDLRGVYQQKNICTVLAAIDELKRLGFILTEEHKRQGFATVQASTGLQGRWQILGTHPLMVCDTGHNTDGLKMVLHQIKHTQFNQLHMILGFVNDKDIETMLTMLPKDASYYFTNAQIPRALKAEELKEKAQSHGLTGKCYATVKEAMDAARQVASTHDMIFIGGSNFIVAEVL